MILLYLVIAPDNVIVYPHSNKTEIEKQQQKTKNEEPGMGFFINRRIDRITISHIAHNSNVARMAETFFHSEK